MHFVAPSCMKDRHERWIDRSSHATPNPEGGSAATYMNVEWINQGTCFKHSHLLMNFPRHMLVMGVFTCTQRHTLKMHLRPIPLRSQVSRHWPDRIYLEVVSALSGVVTKRVVRRVQSWLIVCPGTSSSTGPRLSHNNISSPGIMDTAFHGHFERVPVEVRQCEDLARGHGLFALRWLSKGEVRGDLLSAHVAIIDACEVSILELRSALSNHGRDRFEILMFVRIFGGSLVEV